MYTPTIGLEVHAELKTKSKMFCGCKNDPHDSLPNTNVCPICMAHPGTLPVANQAAVEAVLLFGSAVHGTLSDYSEFDRKNYFYPDIPKAYQISQYQYPFVTGGELGGVALTRVHLEEDTARSQHDKGATSLVDYNRAGVPLMELVTEPVIHDAKAAGDFARELQLLLRTLQISDANMERGEMRVEVNISLSDTAELGTKVEVKNINSFKAAEAAIAYEIKRQTALLTAGETIQQETRGWNENTLETVSQRSKETAKDYRYFPDPDLPKLQISTIPEFSASRLDDKLPVLPAEKRLKYSDIGLPSSAVETIIADPVLDSYFSAVSAHASPSVAILAANYLLTDLSPHWSAKTTDEDVINPLSSQHFADLIALVATKDITSRVAKDLIAEFASKDTDVVAVAKERNLLSTLTEDDVRTLVQTVLAENPTMVAEYQAGKTNLIQFFLGQVMKQTKGAADPVVTRTILEAELQ